MRHVAATSDPMKPAPTTTTRGPRVEAGAQVERVDRRCAARRCRRGRACPAACAARRRSRAARRRTAATRRPRGSAAVRRRRARWPARPGAARRRARRTACVAAPAPGAPTPPRAAASTAADGRTGRCGSAPTSTIRPSNPSRRNVSVARSPASEAPTTTTVRTPPLSSPQGACAPRRPSVDPRSRPNAHRPLSRGADKGRCYGAHRESGTEPRTRALVQVEPTFDV